MIIQIKDKEQLNICLQIIRNSFITVAEEFGLTESNCPSHIAFMTIDKLEKQFDDGRPMFIFYQDNIPVGYFSLAKCSNEEWGLNNLAVLPEYRHLGIGKAMIDYAVKMVIYYGGTKISIGIIEENTTLKNWYLNLGFKHVSTRKFEHLPFSVGFMEFEIITQNNNCYCGHDCARCVTYKATQNNDNNLRKQSKTFYKEQFGLDIPLDKINCKGGRTDNAFELCKVCPFIKCCKEHKIDFCKDCPEYPCKDISEYQLKYVNKCNQL